MIVLSCPNCGPRNVAEFRYGGEVHPRPPVPEAVSDEAWIDFIYMRANKAGRRPEWWYHRNGCGLWFLAERDTTTNTILSTYLPGQGERHDA